MRVELNPPRTARTVGASYILEAEGVEDLQLPIKETDFESTDTPDGPRVEWIVIPRWLAEDRGLVQPEKETTEQVEQMSRHDWFTAAAITGLIASGWGQNDIVWQARKIADKAVQQ